MNSRQLLGLVGLTLLLFLAGCSEASTGIEPGIEDVEQLSDNKYRVTFEIRNTAPVDLHDIEIYGYTAQGNQACTATTETASPGKTTVTTTCSEFPSLLVPAVAEPCSRTPDKPGLFKDAGPISHHITAFVGYGNGSYMTEYVRSTQCGATRNDVDGYSLPPSDRQFTNIQCRQWRTNDNVSIIQNATWMDRPRAEPNVTLSYRLRMVNANATTADYVHGNKSWHPEQHLTDDTQELFDHHVQTQDGRRNRHTASLTREQFFRLHNQLSNESIVNHSDLPRTASSYSDYWDNELLFINCAESPENPKFDGFHDKETRYFVEYDDEQWYVVLTYKKTWSGPTVANESVSNTSSSSSRSRLQR